MNLIFHYKNVKNKLIPKVKNLEELNVDSVYN